MANIVKFYISPKDIYDKLSDEEKNRYNSVAIKNTYIENDGTVMVEAFCYNDTPMTEDAFRRKLLT